MVSKIAQIAYLKETWGLPTRFGPDINGLFYHVLQFFQVPIELVKLCLNRLLELILKVF